MIVCIKQTPSHVQVPGMTMTRPKNSDGSLITHSLEELLDHKVPATSLAQIINHQIHPQAVGTDPKAVFVLPRVAATWLGWG